MARHVGTSMSPPASCLTVAGEYRAHEAGARGAASLTACAKSEAVSFSFSMPRMRTCENNPRPTGGEAGIGDIHTSSF